MLADKVRAQRAARRRGRLTLWQSLRQAVREGTLTRQGLAEIRATYPKLPRLNSPLFGG